MAQSREAPRAKLASWISWVVGAALVIGVILVSVKLTQARQLLDLLQHVRLDWLAVAIGWQVLTYGAQAEVWLVVARAAGEPIKLRNAWQLSVAKLFLDQALPSAGIASSAVSVEALRGWGLSEPHALAAAALNLVSYNLAYVAALVVALAYGLIFGHVNVWIMGLAVLFTVFCLGTSAAILALGGRPGWKDRWRVLHWPGVRNALGFVREADPALTRQPSLIARTTACQIGIIVLDTLTLLALIRSLSADAAVMRVFVSFMIASLVRTMGFVPGGLGTFEASSILTLRAAGLTLPVALSATLLFRGVTFWLPMIPGFVASRRAAKQATTIAERGPV
jgi:Mg2+-importing ATPase